MNDSNSLAHTKWNCKYHVVFAPKYRRKVFYKEKRVEIGKILRMLCEWKSVRIIEAEVCPEYRNREFWCRGYYVDTAGKNAKKIQEYIQQQYEKDKAGEQLTMPNCETTRLRVASSKLHAGVRSYLRDVTRGQQHRAMPVM